MSIRLHLVLAGVAAALAPSSPADACTKPERVIGHVARFSTDRQEGSAGPRSGAKGRRGDVIDLRVGAKHARLVVQYPRFANSGKFRYQIQLDVIVDDRVRALSRALADASGFIVASVELEHVGKGHWRLRSWRRARW